MKKLALYSPRPNSPGQSFKGDKRHTVPSQSLSLREILRRYVRRQPLPTSNDVQYDTRFGDIEKMAKLDITEQKEIAKDLRAKIKAFEEGVEKQKAAHAASLASTATPEAGSEAYSNSPTPTKNPKNP